MTAAFTPNQEPKRRLSASIILGWVVALFLGAGSFFLLVAGIATRNWESVILAIIGLVCVGGMAYLLKRSST